MDESPVLKRPFSGRPAFVIGLRLDQCLQGADWGAVWPLLLSLGCCFHHKAVASDSSVLLP